jgi:hypothetical protein
MKRVSLVVTFWLSLLLVLMLSYADTVWPVRMLRAMVPHSQFEQPVSTSPAQAVTDSQRSVRSLPLFAPAQQLQPQIQIAQAETEEPESPQPFDQFVKGKEQLDGLFTLYRDRTTGKLYVEIKPEQLNVNYLCTVTLESGIGQSGIYSGLPLADGLFIFRQVDNKVQFLMPNVYFRTDADDPLQTSVQRSFSSSVLQALPIKSHHPTRKSVLVDLGPLFLSDFPGLTPVLKNLLGASYTLDANKSHFGAAKAFPFNMELESIYGFSGRSEEELPAFVEALPDSRSFNLKVRYSLSRLPAAHGYRPRRADNRVGYFVTAFQNLSDSTPRTPFVRYINRWHLEKQTPDLPLSPPKQPIVFWIENTVPVEYRDAVRDGVLMWNKAFEKAGFQDAIQVKQMPPNATWDPADIRYNTIRWIASFESGFLGMGPPRVNPLTGEILDADILIDASFARYFKEQYQILRQSRMQIMTLLATLTGTPDLCSYGTAAYSMQRSLLRPRSQNLRLALKLLGNYDLCFGLEATHQLAIGSMAMTLLQGISPNGSEMRQFVQEFLRYLIAHEVGHTLGLRHNFRASAMLSPAELNHRETTHHKGLLASVMDYSAVNLAPAGTPQGDYFTHTVGPYDEWAIAYGYSPAPSQSLQSEQSFLEPIARRAAEADLAYATDEDTFARLDPQINPFDLSDDLLTYAPWQLENARRMWQRLEQRYPTLGQHFGDGRVMFDEIFEYYFQYARFLTRYVGGQSFNRFASSGDRSDRLPFEPVSLEKQRQALVLLQKYVFDENQFRFSPSFLNRLAPSRWNHWGEVPEMVTLDYPIHDRVLFLQSAILQELLDYNRLARLRDAELRSPDQALTIPELFETLEMAVWREVLQPEDTLRLSSLRRGLQREHLRLMSDMVRRTIAAPEDARTLAWYNLRQLRSALDRTLRKANKLDAYTRAHLEETRDRIDKTLNAQLQSQ